MPYVKIPLKKQLDRAARGVYVHPEYIQTAIRAWADMPIAAYLGTADRRREFRGLLGITEEEESAMAYREAVQRIRPWFDGEGSVAEETARRALYCLAEPLLEAYRKWKEQRNENAKDTT